MGARCTPGGKTSSRGGHVGNVAGIGGARGGAYHGSAPNVSNVAGYMKRRLHRLGRAHRRSSAASSPPRAAPRTAAATATAAACASRRTAGRSCSPDATSVRRVGRTAALAAVGGSIRHHRADEERSRRQSRGARVPGARCNRLYTSENSATRSPRSTTRDAHEPGGNAELPYGSLVWASDDDVAACLLPTDTGKPLTQVALLALNSGNYPIVLGAGQSTRRGLRDLRRTRHVSGLIWAEADILDGVWRVYTARSDGASWATRARGGGRQRMGDATIAAVGNRAFWQVLPKASGSSGAEPSLFKRATMGRDRHRDARPRSAAWRRRPTPPAIPWSSRRAPTRRPSTTSSRARGREYGRARHHGAAHVDEAARSGLRQHRVHISRSMPPTVRRRHLKPGHVRAGQHRDERRLQRRPVVPLRLQPLPRSAWCGSLPHGEVADLRSWASTSTRASGLRST